MSVQHKYRLRQFNFIDARHTDQVVLEVGLLGLDDVLLFGHAILLVVVLLATTRHKLIELILEGLTIHLRLQLEALGG